MKERTNEETLELFADLLEPFGELLADKEVVTLLQAGKMLRAISVAIKAHKSAVIEILARVDGEEPENYKVNIFTIPKKMLDILNNPELQNLFISQDQKNTVASFGSAMENTEANEH